ISDILEAQNTLKELANMETYTIEIEEVLSRVVEVEATSVEEAQDIVYEQYRNEEIIYNSANLDKENMGLVTWKNAPEGRVLKSDTTVAKKYLKEDQIKRLERNVSE